MGEAATPVLGVSQSTRAENLSNGSNSVNERAEPIFLLFYNEDNLFSYI